MSALASASGVHTTTISAMMFGERQTAAESIDRVADAIASRLPGRRDPILIRVRELVGQAMTVTDPFRPHPDADLLTARERAAVNELIALLTASKRRASAPDEEEDPPIEPKVADVLAARRRAEMQRMQDEAARTTD